MRRIAGVVCLAFLFVFPTTTNARQAPYSDSLLTATVPNDFVVYYSIVMGKEASIINSRYASGRRTIGLVGAGSNVVWELGMIPMENDTLYTSHRIGGTMLVVPKHLAQQQFLQFLKIVRGSEAPDKKTTEISVPLERLH